MLLFGVWLLLRWACALGDGGPGLKKGFTLTTCYQRESTHRFMSEAIGLTNFPGATALAADMEEFISGD
jgi:hypothetical protein